jgi:hypothetical protein
MGPDKMQGPLGAPPMGPTETRRKRPKGGGGMRESQPKLVSKYPRAVHQGNFA